MSLNKKQKKLGTDNSNGSPLSKERFDELELNSCQSRWPAKYGKLFWAQFETYLI